MGTELDVYSDEYEWLSHSISPYDNAPESWRDIVVAMGLEDPWQIGPHDMRERVNGAKSNTIDAIYYFAISGQLLEDAA